MHPQGLRSLPSVSSFSSSSSSSSSIAFAVCCSNISCSSDRPGKPETALVVADQEAATNRRLSFLRRVRSLGGRKSAGCPGMRKPLPSLCAEAFRTARQSCTNSPTARLSTVGTPVSSKILPRTVSGRRRIRNPFNSVVSPSIDQSINQSIDQRREAKDTHLGDDRKVARGKRGLGKWMERGYEKSSPKSL